MKERREEKTKKNIKDSECIIVNSNLDSLLPPTGINPLDSTRRFSQSRRFIRAGASTIFRISEYPNILTYSEQSVLQQESSLIPVVQILGQILRGNCDIRREIMNIRW